MARKRRDELLSEVAEFFRKGGVRLASVEDIAKALGVARSALYYHFGSRGDMVYAILCHNLEMVAAKVREIFDYPLGATDRLILMIRAVVQLEAENPSLGLSAVFRLDPDLLTAEQRKGYIAKRDEYDGYFRSVIQQGIDSGEFRDVDARIVAFGLLAMLTEFVGWYRPEGPLAPKDIAARRSPRAGRGRSRRKIAGVGSGSGQARDPVIR
jgi:AcrR family transcriptional regulator